jgi:hypothetical protein
MGQSAFKNPRKIFSQASTETVLNNRVTTLENNEYNSSFKNIKKNISAFEVQEIKKVLTKSQINKIVELNNYDFELYDFLMTNKGVFQC